MYDLPINYDELHFSERKKVREQYIEQQDGLCFYCKSRLDGPPAKSVRRKKINKRLFPKNFFRYPVHLHHNHDTSMTIGAVHNYCNAVLWQYEGE